MTVIDLNAVRKWNKIPKHHQEALIKNVFCTSCGVTTIVDYTLHDDPQGLLLEGKCLKCGKPVARFVEDI